MTQPTPSATLEAPEMDPLREEDALQESQIVEIQADLTTGRLGLLFDLRQAIQLRTANTGLLVFGGMEELVVLGIQRGNGRFAQTVIGSVAECEEGRVHLILYLVPHGEIRVRARDAAFYAGDIPGLPAAPPDFIDSAQSVIVAGMPSMRSPIELMQAVNVWASD